MIPYIVQTLMGALGSAGFSLSSAKRIRIRLLEMQIIEQEGDKYAFMSRKWRVLLKNRSTGKGSC